MKTRTLMMLGILAIFLSGCLVFSFHPLYTDADLFPNDLLIGDWQNIEVEENAELQGEGHWKFVHPEINGKENKKAYVLKVRSKKEGEVVEQVFDVHLIKLEEHYFLDFFLKDYYQRDDIILADLHTIPVHTFAKLSIAGDSLHICWLDPEWLEKKMENKKIKIKHEANDDFFLLTASTKDLQKLVKKYSDSKEAYKEGFAVELKRK